MVNGHKKIKKSTWLGVGKDMVWNEISKLLLFLILHIMLCTLHSLSTYVDLKNSPLNTFTLKCTKSWRRLYVTNCAAQGGRGSTLMSMWRSEIQKVENGWGWMGAETCRETSSGLTSSCKSPCSKESEYKLIISTSRGLAFIGTSIKLLQSHFHYLAPLITHTHTHTHTAQ